jgi:protein-S-isoprenylcysteine O-methyltransferase Ste14
VDEHLLFDIALTGIFVAAAATAVALLFTTAPYGRFLRDGWGPTLPSTAGWMLMELPAVLTIAVCFLLGDRTSNPLAIVFLGLWELHYVYRTLVFPFRRRGGRRPMPLGVVLLAVLFNVWNGYLNGRWLFALGPPRGVEWFGDPRFIVGAAMFLIGLGINFHSDNILLKLRAPGETRYEIPRGGLFRFVSAPNYLGELLEWTGWALATWSLAGLSFAVFTAANLAPRAWSNHRWYRERFADYPEERRALIPFVF